MRFDWDSGNIDHISLHDVTPEEAEQVIQNDPVEIGTVERSSELRIVHVGEFDAGRVLVVASPTEVIWCGWSPPIQPAGNSEVLRRREGQSQ